MKRTRARENSSTRPMTLATRASRTRWLQRNSPKPNTIRPCCNRCAKHWAAWPMARSAGASWTVDLSKSAGLRPCPDHEEARIFHVHPEATDETTVLAPQHHVHRHPKGRGEAREHPDDAHRFFGEVARTIDGVDAILIVGPSSAKLEFFKYVHEHERRLESKV